ncbi:leucine-rich repeat domain-containing protein [Flavobacterium sp.]|uniref:T9SS type A sorting domain-containing protein n=1 Tax=Flavobacterium sp. TaxID=239 RepID=UPI0025F07B10|nr:leucine-rich repeat domain-containing protein [Flavobacterium sp.]
MKNILIVMLLYTGIMSAQIVNIPDANFKNRLIYLGIDTNADGQIQVSEALAATSVLNISGSSISDLTGFEAFSNVTILKCPNNQLTAINLSNLPNLKSIDAGFNTSLNAINLNNVSLDTLKVYNNDMPSLDLNSLTSLKHLDCSYNHITSLNLTSMTNLKFLNCDHNWLTGGIAVATLTNLEDLNCSSNQMSSLNVAPLTNLKKLVCSYNIISNVDVSNLTNLEYLDWSNNQNANFLFANVPSLKTLICAGNTITSLNISSVPSLQYLDCSSNHLTSINVGGLTNLQSLFTAINELTNIDVTGLTSLQTLNVFGNLLPSLTVSGLNNLITLEASSNQLSTLMLTGLVSLNSLSLGYNQLPSINVSEMTQLQTLYCNHNQLSSLDTSGLTQLQYLYCYNNLLTNLVLTSNTSLRWLDFNFNQLTSVDFTGLTSLENVFCGHNQLISLDFSGNPSFNALGCGYNNLLSINIKNGFPQLLTNVYYWDENPNLAFVCADEGELAQAQQILVQSTNVNNGNVVLNSYCSFVPGGNYNTITGVITFDHDNNGCDANDPTQPNIRMNINEGTTQGATFTGTTGNYKFYTQAGNFTITPEIENPAWFTFSPDTATIPFADNNNNTVTQNFCLTPNGSHSDVEMVIQPLTTARPGFNAVYKLVYKNKGNTTADVYLNFNFDDAILDLVSSSAVPTLTTSGHILWTILNLQPFQSGSVLVTLHLNAPTDTPPVNIGDILTFTSFIDITTDENWDDNAFTLHQTVVGSFDPNAIICLEGDTLPVTEIGKFLHYGITFENTGNYAAENVVVKDVIDTTKYDINSLQVLGTSYPSYIKITGNIVEFVFENINLAAASGGPPVGGHGDVLFKIKSKDDLVNGDYVSKSAKIYFDYNAPITTNDALTTFATLNNPIHEFDNSVRVYPNPAHTIINISCNFTIQSVALYDIQGRLLETDLANNNQVSFDISDKSNGVYFIKITSDKGSKVEKIVKE